MCNLAPEVLLPSPLLPLETSESSCLTERQQTANFAPLPYRQSDSRPGTSARTKTLEYVGLPRGGQRYRSTTQVTRGINKPPYTAPTHVIYPPEAVPNPYVGDMAVQPVFDNLPAACLYRPDKLPVDMDNRLHVGSVWMGVEKDSCE